MAKKKTELEVTLESSNPEVPRPRLSKLIIKNFRCIGNKPVEIELDDIVVLVGSNNAGKSTILKAYEVIMSQGSNAGKLSIDDFPNGEIIKGFYPEIELHTVVHDNSPGERWIRVDEVTQEKYVREQWIWEDVGAPKRRGYDVEQEEWSENVPWGAPNVANSQRPQAHLVEAFENPEKQANEITEILSSIISERVKSISTNKSRDESDEGETDYEKLLNSIQEMQEQILLDSKEQIVHAENELSSLINDVFPGYEVKFDARPHEDLEKSINLFKAKSQLLMGPQGGYQSSIARQGSGARRTLLWAALRFVNETELSKKKKSERPHVLLLDEPELCLHPSAIREACKSLYDLPKNRNWQVMVTTHSPAFIDLARDNTTIVRVERSDSGDIKGTTLFRPKRALLDINDKKRLKLLNMFDPYVAEFFFGGHSIIVEGDTEYTAFKYILESEPELFKGVHIIRARGKDTIASLVKILNHFDSSYSVLHDSDRPYTNKIKINGEPKKNKAWTSNEKIIESIRMHNTPDKVRLLASVPNFEEAYFNEEVKGEKPYNALMTLTEDTDAFDRVRQLLKALIDHTASTPNGCIEWETTSELLTELENRGTDELVEPL
ncbi:ATP-dependent nuclease [Cytobacillus purgationiresistens]|uniref:ATP-dependent endonuclease of OLD family n=1 Tax=Cytobacillus purgationiresistens TaxID=863449 RepID=A0ABU0AHK7_9BACI|nr:AAA family ATPase [Cytobacillus purgationiresistens]MDQ0269913.1 putative ATP-dependent endonuclease of OLD family [Cytobacillus purgationiresistens]